MEQLAIDFSGKTYDHTRDRKRLNTQFQRVQDFMSDLQWHTLEEILGACGGTQTSCSARFRDLKNKLGWVTLSECVEKGLWRYRVVSFGVRQ